MDTLKHKIKIAKSFALLLSSTLVILGAIFILVMVLLSPPTTTEQTALNNTSQLAQAGVALITPPPTLITESLLKQGYLGAIRTPNEHSSTVTIKDVYPTEGIAKDGTNFSAGPFAIDSQRNEFVLGTRYGRVVRLKMVEPKLPSNKIVDGKQVPDPSSYPVAPYVDGIMLDYSNNTWSGINYNGNTDAGQGAFLPMGDKILVMGTVYYDAGYSQTKSIFSAEWPVTTVKSVNRTPWKTIGSPLKKLTQNGTPILDGSGNFTFVQPEKLQGHIAGPMAPIPLKWQAALKGDVLSGQSGLPIISRQCLGPCAFTYWSKDVVSLDQPPATLALGYVDGHEMSGHPWASPTPSDYFNNSTQITGIAIVGDDIVFVGWHGYGPACYGKGTADQSLTGTTDPTDGGHWCYDPLASGKGTHAYPYRAQAWVYPVSVLVEIIEGKRLPWNVMPTIIKLDWLPIYPHPYYATHPSAIPTLQPIGVGYHEATQRLYIGVKAQDGYGWEPGPLFHVIKIGGTGGSYSTPYATPAPPPPTLTCGLVPNNTFEACYYDNSDKTNLKLVRNESSINNDWGNNSPSSLIGVDSFSATWTGNFSFDAGTYKFTASTDDGMRVTIDNTVIIDKYFNQAPTTYTATLSLNSGMHKVKVEYYEATHTAVAKLSWIKEVSSTPSPSPYATPYSTPTVVPTQPSNSNNLEVGGDEPGESVAYYSPSSNTNKVEANNASLTEETKKALVIQIMIQLIDLLTQLITKLKAQGAAVISAITSWGL